MIINIEIKIKTTTGHTYYHALPQIEVAPTHAAIYDELRKQMDRIDTNTQMLLIGSPLIPTNTATPEEPIECQMTTQVEGVIYALGVRVVAERPML